VSVETEQHTATGPISGYAPPEDRPPLVSYAAMAALFNVGIAGSLAAARRSGRDLPDHVGTRDVLLIGTATHKLSRLIAKDKITSFIRAPFTRYQDTGGPSELQESPRGSGLQHAVGELIACPYCLGMWTSAGFHVGLLYAPRVTRLLASTFTALTISDFLQIAYKAAEDKGLGGS
jgi:hypothetical protein